MDGYCSTGRSPQWAVVPMEEEESIEEQYKKVREEIESVREDKSVPPKRR